MYSFASSQSPLPPPVVDALKRGLLRSHVDGLTLLELPFAGARFEDIRSDAERGLRDLLHLAESQHVLFLQGGASAHFGLLPANFLRPEDEADYVESGLWSKRAIEAARTHGRIRVAGRGQGCALPKDSSWRVSPRAVYCHMTTNETAEGLQFQAIPHTGDVPLVADMTGDFLTRVVPRERLAFMYASAQKNLGVAGLTVVIVDERMLRRSRRGAPAPFDYALQAAARSKVNTPPTFAIAVAAEMIRWLKGQGGLEAAAARAGRKADRLYREIDRDGFYGCPAQARDRSVISVCFRLAEQNLEADFLAEAEDEGLFHLAGHPAVGGLRASLYNGVPEEAADALAGFMADFRRRKG